MPVRTWVAVWTPNSGPRPDADSSGPHPHEPLDDWLRRELLAAYEPYGYTTRWPAIAIESVMQRLQAARHADGPPLTANVLWIREVTAFTLPGRYVYTSRRLLERCATESTERAPPYTALRNCHRRTLGIPTAVAHTFMRAVHTS